MIKRGAALQVGETVIVNGAPITIAAIRRATHRPDVTRIVTDDAGRETAINTRCKYEARS